MLSLVTFTVNHEITHSSSFRRWQTFSSLIKQNVSLRGVCTNISHHIQKFTFSRSLYLLLVLFESMNVVLKIKTAVVYKPINAAEKKTI